QSGAEVEKAFRTFCQFQEIARAAWPRRRPSLWSQVFHASTVLQEYDRVAIGASLRLCSPVQRAALICWPRRRRSLRHSERESLECSWCYKVIVRRSFEATSDSIGSAQPVADSGLGVNVFRFLGVIFKLLPELPYVNTQILGIAQVTPEFG